MGSMMVIDVKPIKRGATEPDYAAGIEEGFGLYLVDVPF
jgi:hypothetical protein